MNKTSQITLKAARVNNGYTQTDAASLIGVSAQTIVNWESGKTYPDALQVAKICDLYKVNFADINFKAN